MQLHSPMFKEMKFLQPLFYLLIFIATSLNLPAQTALLADFDFAAGGYTLLLMPKDDNFRDWTADEEGQDTFPVTYIDEINALGLLKKSMVYEREEDDTLHYCNPNMAILVCKKGEAEEIISMSRQCSAIFSSKGRFENQGYFDYHKYQLAGRRVDRFPTAQRARQVLDSMRLSPNLIWFYEPEWAELDGKFQFYQYDPEVNQAQMMAKMKAMIETSYPGELFELKVTEDQSDETQLLEQWKGHFAIEVTCNESLFRKFGDSGGDNSGFEPFQLVLESYWKSVK